MCLLGDASGLVRWSCVTDLLSKTRLTGTYLARAADRHVLASVNRSGSIQFNQRRGKIKSLTLVNKSWLRIIRLPWRHAGYNSTRMRIARLGFRGDSVSNCSTNKLAGRICWFPLHTLKSNPSWWALIPDCHTNPHSASEYRRLMRPELSVTWHLW